ncbi:MAG: hypothetical protein QM709_02570 [Spongiibacteraceae bacterium]
MKQLTQRRDVSQLTKTSLLVLLAALPLLASASTAGIFGTDALLPDTAPNSAFDWPRFALLAAGVIALVRARSAAISKP